MPPAGSALTAPAPTTSPPARRRRLVAGLLALALLAAFGARAVWAFAHDRTVADAAPGAVAYQLQPVDSAVGADPEATFSYRPDKWLSVVDLHGLTPPPPGQRYLVFMRYGGGWLLAGAVRPGADGGAQLRYGADPPPHDVFEVMVTRGVDTAEPDPHGTPLLRWVHPEITSFKRDPWPIELVD